jgi:Tol biopolymer transport system component
MKKFYLVFVLFILTLYSCPFPERYKYDVGTFPVTPVNMGDINSAYDDYNSTSPELGGGGPLCFSSNRGSHGGNFDIIYKSMNVLMDRTDGKLSVTEENSDYLNIQLNRAARIINSAFNEFGPYLIPQGWGGSTYPDYNKYIFLYASDEIGNLDIKLTENLTRESFTSPQDIKFLNSKGDDAYPTLNEDSTAIYFCSNRELNFDIYRADLNKKPDLLSELTDTSDVTITKELILSSTNDDKCPFILGDLLVFASDRTGGYGGYDLYYSILKDGNWSTPVNFGDKINTPYDEYRPIVKTFFEEFNNDFMIFSSNRPEGKGGFDLYYVGIDKMTNVHR